ncbi:2OG-Fe(II) oxygenase [Sphingomonas sp.]|uniref:prolyl hydroxylase family protein n=1 Tax=Sphingomonas sp. TaxID=28214 RepID=UPI001D522A74|nr:2OG-Fe(II) oxygenase [Sphingomonas sp.]MBX9797223.1 2OG-Fe(II) oxygenase [Sphingomonas sp.]
MSTERFAGAQKLPFRTVEMVAKRQFLSADECTALIALIDAQRRPSGLADHVGDASYRTSETCDLDPAHPLVAGITRRLADFAGLDVAHAEPLQGQRYAVGQEFKLHTDYFEPTGPDFERYCGRSGQRSWTLMVYLNEPGAGGATRFKRLDRTFQPETGKLLGWNNIRPDGVPNYDTLHQGLPVRRGTKYIITSWFRDHPWAG